MSMEFDYDLFMSCGGDAPKQPRRKRWQHRKWFRHRERTERHAHLKFEPGPRPGTYVKDGIVFPMRPLK
jgi:hypothetical protein